LTTLFAATVPSLALAQAADPARCLSARPENFGRNQVDSARSAGRPAVSALSPTPNWVLDELIQLAFDCNPGLRAARAGARAATASITTARTIANPDVEVLPSRFRPRPGAQPLGGAGTIAGVSQRLENPALRGARIGAARAGAEVAGFELSASEQGLAAAVRVRFFDLLRRQEELGAARDDRALVEQIRARINVSVEQGESPRFDLLRADAEVAIAQRQESRARSRVAEGRALLRQIIGPALGEGFSARGDYFAKLTPPDSAALHLAVQRMNPELRRAIAEEQRAERIVALERSQRFPSVSLRLSNEREPEQNIVRAGVALALPIWDRRSGPIREATAQLERRRAEAEQRRFELARAVEVAWQQYRSALEGVALLEGAALEDASAAVRVAEAAYRAGERGILELLDARRQLRAVRSELISAQFDLYVARAELDRLAATAVPTLPADAP